MSNITTWATLKTEVANQLNHTNLTNDVPFFIQLAEFRIYRELRVRQMETVLNSTMSSGQIAVPSGYRSLKFAYIDGTPVQKLERKDAEWIYHNYPTRSASSKPFYIAREGGNFIFGPFPDSAYTVKGVFYKQLDLLSDSNTSNWLITDAPDLIYFAALCEAKPWLGDDERIAIWERKYEVVKQRVQLADNAEEFSGGPLAATRR